MTTTIETITVKQVIDLQREARNAGDEIMVSWRELALIHDPDAIAVVVEAIHENEAQGE